MNRIVFEYFTDRLSCRYFIRHQTPNPVCVLCAVCPKYFMGLAYHKTGRFIVSLKKLILRNCRLSVLLFMLLSLKTNSFIWY